VATNTVLLVGDQSSMVVKGTNLTAVDPIVFLSGSFRASPEERRVASVFLSLEAGLRTIELRIEWSDPRFVQSDVAGQPVYQDDRASL